MYKDGSNGVVFGGLLTRWFCKAIVQKYQSDYKMIIKYTKQWVNRIYSGTHIYRMIYFAAEEIDNVDIVHRLIQDGLFQLETPPPPCNLSAYNMWKTFYQKQDINLLFFRSYYGSSLKTIQDICKDGNKVDSRILATIIKSKDIETLTWILDNNLYDKLTIDHGHYGNVEISLSEYSSAYAKGIIKLLLSRYNLTR